MNKGLKSSKVLFEEGFEVRPPDKIGAFVTALVLSPFEADRAMEE